MLLLDEVCVCAQSCLTLGNLMDYSLPGSTAHGIFQAGKMKWVAISSSRGSSWPMDWTCVSCISCIGRQILYHWATWEVREFIYVNYIHWLMMLLSSTMFLLISSLLDLSVSGQEVLKSPTTKVVGFICFPCNFISFCLMLLPLMCIHINTCYIFLENWPLHHHVSPFLFLIRKCNSPYFEVCSIWN